MPERELIVVGGGEHGRVVIDAALSRPDLWRVAGFVDAKPCEETAARFGVPWLGDFINVTELRQRQPNAIFAFGIGAITNPEMREGLVARFAGSGATWVSIIHRDASVSPTAVIGEGTVVFTRAAVNTGARVGRFCVVNTSAVIEHDVMLGDYSQAAPGSTVGGGAAVGSGSYLGLGSRIRDHIHIGDRVFVAMGAVVTQDVPSGSEVMGVPARPRNVNV